MKSVCQLHHLETKRLTKKAQSPWQLICKQTHSQLEIMFLCTDRMNWHGIYWNFSVTTTLSTAMVHNSQDRCNTRDKIFCLQFPWRLVDIFPQIVFAIKRCVLFGGALRHMCRGLERGICSMSGELRSLHILEEGHAEHSLSRQIKYFIIRIWGKIHPNSQPQSLGEWFLP